MDGYPYTGLMEFGGGSFPEFTDGDTEVPYPHPAMKCSLDLHECFKLPEGVTPSASEIFRNVAFRNPACGDCSESFNSLSYMSDVWPDDISPDAILIK